MIDYSQSIYPHSEKIVAVNLGSAAKSENTFVVLEQNGLISLPRTVGHKNQGDKILEKKNEKPFRGRRQNFSLSVFDIKFSKMTIWFSQVGDIVCIF